MSTIRSWPPHVVVLAREQQRWAAQLRWLSQVLGGFPHPGFPQAVYKHRFGRELPVSIMRTLEPIPPTADVMKLVRQLLAPHLRDQRGLDRAETREILAVIDQAVHRAERMQP